jgi:hypothetical protein
MHMSWEEVDLLGEHRFSEADLAPARHAIAEATEPDPNIVFAIGLGRRADDTTTVLRTLAGAPRGSELARGSLLALYVIGDRSAETERAFLEHLQSPETAYVSTLGLLQLRTPGALAALKDQLAGLTADRLSSSDTAVLIAVNLLRLDEVRLDVANFLWESLDRHRILFVVHDDLSAFADLGRPDVDDWLYELALGDGGYRFDSASRIGATRLLARRDLDRAVEAALRLWGMRDPELEVAAELLLKVDPDRALSHLRGCLKSEDKVLILASIGESLFASGHLKTLLAWLQDPLPDLREGACIASEFIPWTDDLARTLRSLLYDEDWYVRNAANQALDRLWRTREADRFVDELLTEVNTTRRWCLLDVVLETGYPGLWHRQPWIERVWEEISPGMRWRARRRLTGRRKQLRDKLQKRKRRDS